MVRWSSGSGPPAAAALPLLVRPSLPLPPPPRPPPTRQTAPSLSPPGYAPLLGGGAICPLARRRVLRQGSAQGPAAAAMAPCPPCWPAEPHSCHRPSALCAPLPSPSLGGRPPDGQGPPAPVAGALEPACRARRRPAPGREASPVRTQRPQPDCPLGPPAAPPSTYPPTPFDTATRQNTLRRNSASGICPIWLRLAKKRRLGARPSRPAYPAVHIPPTRQNPVPQPSRASPHNSPTRRTAPADASTRPQHISPTRQNARASRPWPPRKPPWPARTTRLPGRAAAVATEASRSLSACQPHPAPPSAGAHTGRPGARDPPAPCPLATSRLPGKPGAETIWHPLQHPGTSPQVNGRCKIYRSRPRPLTLSRS
jgi:hypothetical protein